MLFPYYYPLYELEISFEDITILDSVEGTAIIANLLKRPSCAIQNLTLVEASEEDFPHIVVDTILYISSEFDL